MSALGMIETRAARIGDSRIGADPAPVDLDSQANRYGQSIVASLKGCSR